MKVIKRGGASEEVSFDKVLTRLKKLSADLPVVDVFDIAQKVCGRIYDNVSTCELDELAAVMCSSMMIEHPAYGTLGSRIIVSNHHKSTLASFSDTVDLLHAHGLVASEVSRVAGANRELFEATIDYARDYRFDYFGFKTLERSYLIRVADRVVERPQHMFMRVAIGIHGDDTSAVIQTYNLMSEQYFVHATPTLFNAGTNRAQMSSCFLMQVADDSIEGIFDTVKECAMISKFAGGIGLHMHNVRSKGSRIEGTNGKSDGIAPMLKVLNATARYVNQSGRRNGSIAAFVEPWHGDIFEFLDLKKPHGHEENRARDLFYALWIPDMFMRRVQSGGDWSLMCPRQCPGLSDSYGDEFDRLYESYERQGRFLRRVPAQELWFRILQSQIETGTPYMLYKDACNRKSNHKNLGTIKSSNLCSEIVQYTSPNEIAVCNLASVCLPSFVVRRDGTTVFDFDKLHDVVKVVTRNLNNVIDRTFYPLAKAQTSNARHRPIGIGVQGLADTFAVLGLPFDCPKARALNRDIFETIYHAALEASVELSVDHGAYSSFQGSPASRGELQFDMWGVDPGTSRYDWPCLKNTIRAVGLRNSLLVAPMPTATTSQIMGFNEAFEPFTSNLYKRKTMAGEFVMINKYLVRDLVQLGLWTKEIREKIMIGEGSVQAISEIPAHVRELYKTAWDIKQRAIIDMAADRGAFVCQSQSMNLFQGDPDYQKLTSMHFYAWQRGLKTGMYYLRSKTKAKAQQFTIEPAAPAAHDKPADRRQRTTTCDGDEACALCSA